MVKQQKGSGLADDLGIHAVKTGFVKVSKNIKDYGNMLLHGRNDLQPKVRSILERVGDMPIVQITINRTPVNSMILKALGALSFGEFTKRFEDSPYDLLFHLRLDLKLSNGKTVKIEKNEVINMEIDPNIQPDAQTKVISHIPPNLTPNKLIEGAKKVMGDKFIPYNAVHNNCQDFIMGILQGNNIGDEQDREFVKQYTKEFFKGTDQHHVRRTAKFVTDLGAKVNEIVTGVGVSHTNITKYKSPSYKIQSILFDRKVWTLHHAKKWLKKHGFKTSVDTKPNHLRFRQAEPDSMDNYRTKKIGDDIQLILGHTKSYKNKDSNIDNMNNDTDESSSDEEGEEHGYGCGQGLGLGLVRKRNLIQRMAKLSHDLHDHHHTSGHDREVMEAVKLFNEGLKNQLTMKGGSVGRGPIKKFNAWFKAIGSKFKTLNHNLKPIKQAGTDYAVNYINPMSGAENALNDFQRELPETVEAFGSIGKMFKSDKDKDKKKSEPVQPPQYSYQPPSYSYQQPSYSYQPSYAYEQPTYSNPFADSWTSYTNHMYGNGVRGGSFGSKVKNSMLQGAQEDRQEDKARDQQAREDGYVVHNGDIVGWKTDTRPPSTGAGLMLPVSKKKMSELGHDIMHPQHTFTQVAKGAHDAGKTSAYIVSDVFTGNFDKLQKRKHMPLLKGRGRPKKTSVATDAFKLVNMVINPRSVSNGMGMPVEAKPVIPIVDRKVPSSVVKGTGRPKKGSQEAKDKMARIRAMRKK